MIFQSEVFMPEARLRICHTISFRTLAISTFGGLVAFHFDETHAVQTHLSSGEASWILLRDCDVVNLPGDP